MKIAAKHFQPQRNMQVIDRAGEKKQGGKYSEGKELLVLPNSIQEPLIEAVFSQEKGTHPYVFVPLEHKRYFKRYSFEEQVSVRS